MSIGHVKRLMQRYALAGFLGALAACGGGGGSSPGGGTTISIPNVVGDTQAAATSAITGAGLTAGAVTMQSSATVAAGSVISQNPAAGTSVATGTAVALVVSSGPGTVSVPNVIGDTQAAATSAITGAGLTAGAVTMQSSATVAAGNVIGQNPAAGTSVATGTAVALVVSSGPGTVSVPNVIGDTQAAATSAITGAGLTAGAVTMQSSATVAAGSVISQNPAAGTSVATGTAVALVVSSGPGTVSVPNVIGDTQAAATSAITGAGLTAGAVTMQSSATVAAGNVIGQNPAAGTSVATGTAVALVVSSGPGTVSVPNVVGDTVAQATSALQGVGLTLGTQTTARRVTSPSGEIISQSPAANSAVASGTSVTAVVSTGELETVIYPFAGGTVNDGAAPGAAPIQGSDGNFYGTTQSGGGAGDEGTVFKVTPLGVETVLHVFAGGSDGLQINGGVIQGSDGNFYGTSSFGGANNLGTVFKVTPAGVESVIYSFAGGSDGSNPYAGLIQGSDGNFYGTTRNGGPSDAGTVFRVTLAGVETVLYSFAGPAGSDGAQPQGGLIQATDGNFYGTTFRGGSSSGKAAACSVVFSGNQLSGCGTVFKVTPAGVETVLYSFGAGSDGQNAAGLIQGSDGNFFGTTQSGGSSGNGTLFRCTPAGVEAVLYSFAGGSDGSSPVAGVIQGSDGHFYGTTQTGGSSGNGTLFKY